MLQRSLALVVSLWALGLIPSIANAEVGVKAPDCQLSGLGDRQPYALNKLQGQVLYVDFWASWCPPCVKSFPFLDQLETDFKSRGFKVIAINMDEELQEAKQFLANHPAAFTVVTDDTKQCATAFDVKAMPSSYLIDRKGLIRHVELGFRPDNAKVLRGLVEQLLNEK